MTSMPKTIAVIGAGGQMGKWFSRYFEKKGFEVSGFDPDNPILKTIKKCETLIGAILNVDYVLLSTPTTICCCGVGGDIRRTRLRPEATPITLTTSLSPASPARPLVPLARPPEPQDL